VRGLSSIMILQEIMKAIRRQTSAVDVPLPCDYFDLMGGTGTGGLIAIMLGRLRMVLSILASLTGSQLMNAWTNISS
jgi:patatin-like phospholipase/acyl hydrolase